MVVDYVLTFFISTVSIFISMIFVNTFPVCVFLKFLLIIKNHSCVRFFFITKKCDFIGTYQKSIDILERIVNIFGEKM